MHPLYGLLEYVEEMDLNLRGKQIMCVLVISYTEIDNASSQAF